jgi:hypothetical protein
LSTVIFLTTIVLARSQPFTDSIIFVIQTTWADTTMAGQTTCADRDRDR